MQDLRQINTSGKGAEKILFLGYDESGTGIFNRIRDLNFDVFHSDAMITDPDDLKPYKKIILFGYRNIIGREITKKFYGKIVNLHISFLPYNRGAHPNFWAHHDGTPSGVSIHLVDSGIDTGPILAQRRVSFDPGEKTFSQTYDRLIRELEDLFVANAAEIFDDKLKPEPQTGTGSFHKTTDLPASFAGWDSNIKEELSRMAVNDEKEIARKLEIIDEIEKVRTKNNVNWMDILRLAFRSSPEEAKKLVKKINAEDNRISDLFKKLGE